MAKSDRAGVPEDSKRSLFLLLRKSGDTLEAASPPFGTAVGEARLRDAARTKELLRPGGTPDSDLAVTPPELEEEAPPFDVEAGAAQLREAARARGLLSGGASDISGELTSRTREYDRILAGQQGGAAPRRLRTRVADRVLIIVQNLPVPFDRRVWLECQALVSKGYRVTVVCPMGKGDPRYQVIDGVELYKYRPYAPGGSKLSFVVEYLYSFLATGWLTFKARRSGRFAVVQACNPPDIFWPLALALRTLDGSKFVFDHHDLCPELYESCFPGGAKLPYLMLRTLERLTHRTADHVIAPNDSYRDIAIRRGGKSPADVTVVRTGPGQGLQPLGLAYPELRRGRRFLAAYIGVMGPQDGVDIVIRAADFVVNQLHRDDIAFTLIGSGDCFDELVALRDELGLAGHVEFTGRAPDELITRILSTADVGLSPDPKNALSDLSTMNKTMEYMAFELPVVTFDLREARVSADDAAVYVVPNDVNAFAAAIVELMDDEHRRSRMGKLGRVRAEQVLAWNHQARNYLDVYQRLMGDSEAFDRTR